MRAQGFCIQVLEKLDLRFDAIDWTIDLEDSLKSMGYPIEVLYRILKGLTIL
ncbi:8942_t:CDS:2 [Racocetra fulgida]|uniref:8942_t:CDS:1 n=1 Tax=Racocetra fulgida TaxID=60492 RepID=A0A9N8VSI0_9GLOM|nr:8942_t:CDS:2 [Racocetra fulgida]